jgi:hypothetical protein
MPPRDLNAAAPRASAGCSKLFVMRAIRSSDRLSFPASACVLESCTCGALACADQAPSSSRVAKVTRPVRCRVLHALWCEQQLDLSSLAG